MNKTTLALEVGATTTLSAMVSPSNASDKSIQYVSSDTSVATVTPVQGKIAGVKGGTATITATTKNGKAAICEVTVTQLNEG